MKKIAVIILTVVTLLTAVVGTTYAFFTDSESSAVSTFSSGSLKVELLAEAEMKDDQTQKKMMPGAKIPYIINAKNTGTTDAYVRVRVWVPDSLFNQQKSNGESFDEIEISIPVDNDVWELSAGIPVTENGTNKKFVEYIFTYKNVLVKGGTTSKSIDSYINILDAATLSDSSDADFRFHVEAIQATGFTNAADAFAAFNNQKNQTNP